MNIINLSVGDSSRDGHGMTDIYTIECNVDKNTLLENYKVGCAKINYDLSEEACTEYNEDTISSDIWEKFKDYHDVLEKEGAIPTNGGDVYLDAGSFVAMWLIIAKIGNPNLEYKPIQNSCIDTGGYGLYEC